MTLGINGFEPLVGTYISKFLVSNRHLEYTIYNEEYDSEYKEENFSDKIPVIKINSEIAFKALVVPSPPSAPLMALLMVAIFSSIFGTQMEMESLD